MATPVATIEEYLRHHDLRRVEARLAEVATPPTGPTPTLTRFGWLRVRDVAGRARLVLADDLSAPGRVVFELAGAGDSITSVHPAPGGRLVAVYALAGAALSLHVIDVVSSEQVTVDDARTFGPVAWLPDGEALVYAALDLSFMTTQLRVHPAGPVLPPLEADGFVAGAQLSQDGRFLVAVVGSGLDTRAAHVLELGRPEATWRPLVPPRLGSGPGTPIGEHYVAISTAEHPRGRLVRVTMDGSEDPAPLTSEDDVVLQTVDVVGDHLVLTGLRDGAACIRVLDGEGSVARDVPLPGPGTVGMLGFAGVVPLSTTSFAFSFASPVATTSVWTYDVLTQQVEQVSPSGVQCEDLVVRRHEFRADDGETVSVFVTHRRDLDPDRPHPTLVHAYGGYNGALSPSFHTPAAVFARAGGVFAIAQVRGGGEYGRAWWHSARGRRKQRTFDDLYTAVEGLTAIGLADPDRVAFVGGSAGGLVAATAYSQRPDLFAAVVALVPLVDVRRQLEQLPAPHAVAEFGDLDDPSDAQAIDAYSPLANLRDGLAYPALFVGVGDTDASCPPWHGSDFVARAQAATSSAAPVLLRVWDGGHEVGPRAFEYQLDWTAEWLAFVAEHVGLAL